VPALSFLGNAAISKIGKQRCDLAAGVFVDPVQTRGSGFRSTLNASK
jgi:hypothetical protein